MINEDVSLSSWGSAWRDFLASCELGEFQSGMACLGALTMKNASINGKCCKRAKSVSFGALDPDGSSDKSRLLSSSFALAFNSASVSGDGMGRSNGELDVDVRSSAGGGLEDLPRVSKEVFMTSVGVNFDSSLVNSSSIATHTRFR